MTQEEKQLLLQDICGRLPYGVITKNCRNNFDVPAHLLPDVIGIKMLIDEYDLKPYLRPMSSMTEEEVKELVKVYLSRYNLSCEYRNIIFIDKVHTHDRYSWSAWVHYKNKHGTINQICVIVGRVNWDTTLSEIDWLNEHHFDYRGLIEKGLALEAPEDMYK